MVGQISVFPDVGAAFFGSYRGARNQRLQESAMRAEMAAAQAERQRQAQAREAFARLQGPDQRIEQVQLDPFQRATNRIGGALDEAGIGYGEMPRIGYDEQRITPGLTPQQRALEEQRLAQNDPNLLMAYRQSRQGPEIPDSVYQDLGAAVARGDIPVEGAVARLTNAGVSQDTAIGRLGMYIVPPSQEGVRGVLVNQEGGQILVNPITGEPIAQYGPRPTRASPAETALAGFLNAQSASGEAAGPNANLYASGQILTAGELYEDANVPLPVGVDPETSLQVERQPNGRGNFFRPISMGDAGDEDAPNPNAGLPAGSVYSEVALEETQFGQSLLSENPNSVTGYMGIVRAFADPTSEAGQFRSTLMTLKSNAAFDRLQYIRDNSPTGGAVGQVSNYEQEMLQAANGNIDQANDPALLARRLARYEAILTAASTGVVYDEASDSFRLATVADARAGRVTGLGYNEADRENGLGRGRNQRNITLREVYEITGINPEDAYRAINADVAGELSPAARGWLEGTPLRNGQ